MRKHLAVPNRLSQCHTEVAAARAFQGTSGAMSDEFSRIDTLEMRIAHQDEIIAELNEVITAQWRKIDALERQVVKLHDEYQNMVAPHY